MIKPVVLLILDGWGIEESREANAIKLANTPNYSRIIQENPNTQLITSGIDVGLPYGQMGNSEVGHLNIGSGRVVYQDLTKIDNEITTGNFFNNEVLLENMNLAKSSGKALHLMGLLSDGGVHSHISHIMALLEMAKNLNLEKVYIHAFLDGRDVPPRSAEEYIISIEDFMTNIGLGKIATIQGRYYAMDRDKRWDRLELGYKALAFGDGLKAETAIEAVENSYAIDVNDEFVIPTVIGDYKGLEEGDSLIFFNFRGDRAREISEVLVKSDFTEFPRKNINVNFVCMSEYDENLGAAIAFPSDRLNNTLGEYLSKNGIRQVRIAETEKYAHVTFFFNGGVEEPNIGEDRILVPSPKVATYDLKPEMSVYEVTQKVLEVLEAKKHEVLIINFANGDMVGHTGNIPAAIKAVEAVDECLGKIEKSVKDLDGVLLVTADHGNCECMYNKELKEAITAHSTNPVPFIVVSNKYMEVRKEVGLSLRDISPTILKLLDLEIPEEMTGTSLIKD
ncbi:MAG: 2 3-bisphosphoglycerate-independent phosphoglycerate mutase [Fusobacteria bacterium]|nr:MAG: 2 3-bisphosphoglycerate-independent phosphoglycerate mutase [Fusobacteriota bacterium]KAF0229695.1 MAG: 2 3-bisphosphoglycerate-independent phosphoglycerate [Fusobacteriota bacterium]